MKYILLILLSLSQLTFAQSNIERLVLEKVNTLRDSLNLPKLKYDRLLSEAGKDQAYYMLGKQKLTHFECNSFWISKKSNNYPSEHTWSSEQKSTAVNFQVH